MKFAVPIAVFACLMASLVVDAVPVLPSLPPVQGLGGLMNVAPTLSSLPVAGSMMKNPLELIGNANAQASGANAKATAAAASTGTTANASGAALADQGNASAAASTKTLGLS